MSSELLNFLSRPRILSEVAERFRLTLKEAELLVLKEVESGRISVSSTAPHADSYGSPITETKPKSVTRLDRGLIRNKAGRKLPKVKARGVRAKTGIDRHHELTFKLRRPEPSRLKKPRNPLEMLIRNRENRVRPSRASLPLELRLLEAVQNGSKRQQDLKLDVGVSKKTLEGFVEKGLLRTTWGPNGVGIFFQITEKGRSELDRIRNASRIDERIVSRKLISLKHATPPFL